MACRLAIGRCCWRGGIAWSPRNIPLSPRDRPGNMVCVREGHRGGDMAGDKLEDLLEKWADDIRTSDR